VPKKELCEADLPLIYRLSWAHNGVSLLCKNDAKVTAFSEQFWHYVT